MRVPDQAPSPEGKITLGLLKPGGKTACKRVLIVDDDEQSRAMVARAVKKLWPKIETAQSGDGIHAVRIAKKFLPDLIILDLMLPGQDGFGVLNDLKDHPPLRSTLVLAVTAYNTPENFLKVMKNGAIRCLSKPFGPEELAFLLTSYCGPAETAAGSVSVKKVSEPSVKAGGTRRNMKLVNIAAFLGLMLSTFSIEGRAESRSGSMAKNSRIEEPLKKDKSSALEKVAIMPFESSNLYIAGKSFSDTLVGHLTNKIENLSVIERLDIEKVLSEQRFSMTGAVKQEPLKRAAGIEPVDALVLGTVRTMEYFGEDGGSIVVTVKIVDANDGEILWSHKQEARCYSIGLDKKALGEELMDRAAKKIAKKIKADLFSKKQKVPHPVG